MTEALICAAFGECHIDDGQTRAVGSPGARVDEGRDR